MNHFSCYSLQVMNIHFILLATDFHELFYVIDLNKNAINKHRCIKHGGQLMKNFFHSNIILQFASNRGHNVKHKIYYDLHIVLL